MKKHLLALGLLLAGVSPAQALDVGDISSFMNSGSSTLSKTIKNSTDSGRLINIHLERLSSPLDGGQVVIGDEDITKMKDFKRYRRIGRVYQDPARSSTW